MSLLKTLMGALIAVLMTGCGGSGSAVKSDFIPDIEITCSSGQAADCAGTGLSLFVGLASAISGECDNFLASATTPTQRQGLFAASGTATGTRNGIYLTAIVSSWVNSTGGSVDSLDAGTYAVCAFADTNGNGRVDTNEPVGRGSLTVGSTGFVLGDWAPAFN
jgi:hypothetical protein